MAALVLAALISSPFSAWTAEGRGCMGGNVGGQHPHSNKRLRLNEKGYDTTVLFFLLVAVASSQQSGDRDSSLHAMAEFCSVLSEMDGYSDRIKHKGLSRLRVMSEADEKT